MQHLLAGTPVSYGRFTGDAPETDSGDSRRSSRPDDAPENLRWSRQAMRDNPPSILLTNYTMLEYLLLRGKDDELFRYGAPQYLVVDEIHLFAGVLGAEVGALLRRFRQHVTRGNQRITVVGTSATAGDTDEQARLLEFAERFFGTRFNSDAAIVETPAPLAAHGAETPSTPSLTQELLSAAHDYAGLAALATATFGVEMPADDSFPEALGAEINRFSTVSTVERALAAPAPLSTAAHALGLLPERAATPGDALVREAQAVVLLGAAARLPAMGEDEVQPRFRPRVHQVLRSLAGLWRCVDPSHGSLTPPDGTRCECDSLACSHRELQNMW